MKTCLVVDDSDAIRSIARGILESLSLNVVEAADGQKALEICTNAMPDAILLDRNMPVMNGVDFLRALRQRDGGDGPVVIFCTGEINVSLIQEAISAGADDYVAKPFDSAMVEEKLSQAGVIG
ncbi:MAG: response regulator [Proteobacteria bacterium]|jgi:two-component system, chemotaxis family, chemotaxis protein CheY|nr:response regulator [Pseudomonadota bacterium]